MTHERVGADEQNDLGAARITAWCQPRTQKPFGEQLAGLIEAGRVEQHLGANSGHKSVDERHVGRVIQKGESAEI